MITYTDWKHFISKTKNEKKELAKVMATNNYINRNIMWVKDSKLWRKKDYWATPSQTLEKNAGDCEDISILKYYTLLELGISVDDLFITYVKYRNKEAHMVLTYYYNSNKPLILDNINKELTLSSKRLDLKSVYGFNSKDMLVLKNFSKSKSLGSSTRIKLWVDLMERTIV